jgi:hypothetical protein
MDTVLENLTINEEPQWNSSPAWKLPGWAEPLVRVDSKFGRQD